MSTGTDFWGADTSGLADYSTLTPSAKAVRDKFVDYYLVDYDALRAAQLCGYVPPYASEMASKFMECPYVQNRIRLLQDTVENEDDTIKKRIVQALTKEANYYGHGSSHAARVNALSKLAAIQGMDKLKDNGVLGTNVLVVPAIANIEDWENLAKSQQANLVKNV